MASTILIVDDFADAIESLQTMLEMSGYRVLAARNGVDALTVLSTERCDLVVTDMEMPVMNGLQLIQAIRQARKHADLPIVFISEEFGNTVPSHIAADGFLRKPFNFEALLRMLIRLGCHPDPA